MGLVSDCPHPATALSELHSPCVGHTAPGQARSLENCTFPSPAPPTAPYPCVRGSSHCVVRVLWFT